MSASAYEAHQLLLNRILLAIGSSPNVFVWKNATGVAKSFGDDDDSRVIRFGLPGSSDIIGIIKHTGQFLAIEVKTGSAVQSKQQKNFEKMITNFGGIYILARSVDCVLSALQCYKIV